MIWFALLLGIAFGVTATIRHFCLHGSLLENYTNKRANTGRLTSFVIAIISALVLVQGINMLIMPLRLDASIYLTTRLNILGLALGGFLFGVGMMLAQGCVSRHIIKFASGNLMSLPTLLLVGMFAFAAIAGVFAVPLSWLQKHTALMLEVPQSVPVMLQQYVGVSLPVATSSVLAVYIAILGVIAYAVRQKGQPIWHYWDGVVIAAIIALGWVATTLGYDEFDGAPVASQSLTYTLSVGRLMQYIMLSTSYTFDFTMALVCGSFIGSLATSLAQRTFHITTFSGSKATLQMLIGACLMGIGGVMAAGCNIGQGLSGMSTLSIGSVIALCGILLGSSLVIVIRDRDWLRAGMVTPTTSSCF